MDSGYFYVAALCVVYFSSAALRLFDYCGRSDPSTHRGHRVDIRLLHRGHHGHSNQPRSPLKRNGVANLFAIGVCPQE